MPGPSEWLASIARTLDRLPARWTVIGALAANRYRADERFTTDVDVLAERHPGMDQAIRGEGYEIQTVRSPGEPPHLLRLTRGAEKVDILLPIVEYQTVALARAVDHCLTAEDVIVHKLIAWRARDRDDVRSILEAGIPLDDGYITHWAQEWEVAMRWTQARTGS